MNLDKFYRRKISISEVIDCARLFNDEDTDKFAKFPYIYIYTFLLMKMKIFLIWRQFVIWITVQK